MIRTILDYELLHVTFQPIVRASRAEVYGYEILGGTPSWVPGAPEFERTSRRALADQAFEEGRLLGVEYQWIRLGIESVARQCLDERLRFLVTLDPRILEDGAWTPESLARLTRSHGLSPARFALSLTGPVERLLPLCGQHGFRVAADHLGITPLRQLLRLKPHILRLDPTVTVGIASDPARRHLVASLADFARCEMIDLVACGVTRTEDLEALLEAGIDLVQGDAIAEPEPVAVPLGESQRDRLSTLAQTVADREPEPLRWAV